MKNIFKIILLILIIIILQSAGQVWAQRTGSSLRGGETDKVMKLYWETYEWPEHLIGFNIKKQTKASNGWNKLNKEVITPQIDERNWTNQGLDEEEANNVQQIYLKYISEGKLSKITKGELLQKLQLLGGLKSGDRLNMKQDFNVALILGFGFIDHTYKKSDNASYGLFYVYEDGHESEQAMATFSPEEVKIKPTVEFSVNKSKLKLSWSVSEKDYNIAGLYGFKISRKDDKTGIQTNLTEDLIGYQKSDNGKLQWLFFDESAKTSIDYTYTFFPVTILQTQLKPFEHKFKASLFQSMHTPSIDSISIINDTDIQIYWKADSLLSDKKRIKEFYLEKRNVDTLQFTRITKSLDLKHKSYTDTSNLQYGQSYIYRLSVTDKKGKQWPGTPLNIFYTGVKLPTKPDSLKAEFRMILDKPYVHLYWAKSSSKNAAGFVLQSDEEGSGKLLENLSVPLIKSNEFLYELSGEGGKDYQFRIIPVNERGMRGEGSTAHCKVPLLKLPLFTNISATLNKSNLVELSWDYPKESEVKGFNVLVNDQIIATYEDLPKDSRKYTVQLYLPKNAKKVNVYQVEAIGTVVSRKSSVAPLYLPSYKLPQPEKLTISLIKEKGKSYAALSWEYNKEEKNDIKGFLLFADEGAENAFLQVTKGELLKEMKFNYQIKDLDRNSYTFQVSAVSDKGEISPATSITLNIKDIKK
ncbi:MAG: fibronectin type III domain-containing protein [Sporocytophaga sp.]|uniref:fibronectin type III domain-containing protein n=1 Tax=Sporocytophaga sp. TaxID=2231183 RepID=UPI001B03321F|nr:fibronectin type III domain-containing protein [Sporocytophaga sp.]MBO9703533.1 fibronectin type III domain-containing protein [Sporocytophaga sp.]